MTTARARTSQEGGPRTRLGSKNQRKDGDTQPLHQATTPAAKKKAKDQTVSNKIATAAAAAAAAAITSAMPAIAAGGRGGPVPPVQPGGSKQQVDLENNKIEFVSAYAATIHEGEYTNLDMKKVSGGKVCVHSLSRADVRVTLVHVWHPSKDKGICIDFQKKEGSART